MRYKHQILLVLLSIFYVSIVQAEDPLKVNISILGAVIAPTKENGKPWDGFGRTDTAVLSKVGNLMDAITGVATTAVLNQLSGLSSQGISAPDVIGYVTQIGSTTRPLVNIAGEHIALATKTYNLNKNNYTPSFNVTYEGWPIFKDSRFQIHLWDADFQDNDPIGTVEITYSDIVQAIKLGKSTWIKVADQSVNQLLFIHISALKSVNNTKPKIDGYMYN